MKIRREWFEDLVFGGEASRRWTQDSPVLPDVWLEYAAELDSDPFKRVDLLLTPHRDASAPELAKSLRSSLSKERQRSEWWEWHGGAEQHSAGVAYNQASVAGRFTFPELVRVVLPLSQWWRDVIPGKEDDLAAFLQSPGVHNQVLAELNRLSQEPEAPRRSSRASTVQPSKQRIAISKDLIWMIRIVGTLLLCTVAEPDDEEIGDGETGEGEVHKDIRDQHADDHAIARSRQHRGASPEKQRFLTLSTAYEQIFDAFLWLISGMEAPASEGPAMLYTVTRNRPVTVSVFRSVLAVKADAAQRLFEIDTRNIAWAVIDSGIDARHSAFRRRTAGAAASKPFKVSKKGTRWENQTTVAATYDFSRIRILLDPESSPHERELSAPAAQSGRSSVVRRADAPSLVEPTSAQPITPDSLVRSAQDLTARIEDGRAIDWAELAPLLVVPHDSSYTPPIHDHGTHVAGILGAEWRRDDDPEKWPLTSTSAISGMCPGLTLYDMRVLDQEGRGDEFTVMAALQFIRHINANRDQPAINGANISLSLKHDVANYACGRTPVCEECERLVASGVVVVAAAGNDGYQRVSTPMGESEGYRSISISDPGNAEGVITVGATHRHAPHTYGVSYFSSRGPTGDGRLKPDLVAPGEKITAPVPGDSLDTKDGTSMAAPHVSGAAVIVMARHRELLGNPTRVKQVLCGTATDLGRERYFQGAGMIDVLRALQSL